MYNLEKTAQAAREVVSKWINICDDSLIYIAGSLMEGFGNKRSDVDIYVIQNEFNFNKKSTDITDFYVSLPNSLVRNIVHEGIRYDIEYWQTGNFYKLIKKVNEINLKTNGHIERLSDSEIDALHRLKYARPLFNEALFYEVMKTVRLENLSHYLAFVLSEHYIGYLEDLEGAFLSNDIGTAFYLSRKFLGDMVTAYLAVHGETNPNPKWLFRKLERYQATTGDTELLRTYISLQNKPYDSNAKHVIKEIIQYCQKLNSEVQKHLAVVTQEFQVV